MKLLGCLISFSSSPHNYQSTSASQCWCVCTKLALRANRRHCPALCPQPQFDQNVFHCGFPKRQNWLDVTWWDVIPQHLPGGEGVCCTQSSCCRYFPGSPRVACYKNHGQGRVYGKNLWTRSGLLEFFVLKASQAPAMDVGSCRSCFALSPWAIFNNYPFLPPTNCSQGATFFLSAQLCADFSLERGQNVSPKHHMWVLNIWNLKTWGDSHMVDRVASSLPWEGDPWSGHCHCALPGDGHLAFLSLFPAQNFHPPNGCRTWICWFSYLQSTAARSSELNSLSCQWAPVSLEPILFNIRAYSCSYSLAFLLL